MLFLLSRQRLLSGNNFQQTKETSSPWVVTLSWRPLAKANTIAAAAPAIMTIL